MSPWSGYVFCSMCSRNSSPNSWVGAEACALTSSLIESLLRTSHSPFGPKDHLDAFQHAVKAGDLAF